MSSTEDVYRDWQRTHHALDQSTHAAINAHHYPGTLQMCVLCNQPTGRCEEDSRYNGDVGPLCEDCDADA